MTNSGRVQCGHRSGIFIKTQLAVSNQLSFKLLPKQAQLMQSISLRHHLKSQK